MGLLATSIQLSAHHWFLSGHFLSRLLFSMLGDKFEKLLESLGFKGETEGFVIWELRDLLELLLTHRQTDRQDSQTASWQELSAE